MIISKVISYADTWEQFEAEENSCEYTDLVAAIDSLDSRELMTLRAASHFYRKYTHNGLKTSRGEKLQEFGWKKYQTIGEGFEAYEKNNYSLLFCESLFVDEAEVLRFSILFSSVLSAFDSSYRDVHEGSLIILVSDHSEGVVGSAINTTSFELLKNQLTGFGPSLMELPFFIVGVAAAKPKDISVIPLKRKKINSREIKKYIEFSNDNCQAGISILSYFGEVLKSKHPDTKNKIRIEQQENSVVMTIDTDYGNREIIEKTFNDYGLVLASKMPPETVFDSKMDVLAFKQKLERAEVEVRQTRDILQLKSDEHIDFKRSSRQEIEFLKQVICQQSQQLDQSHKTINTNSESIADMMRKQSSIVHMAFKTLKCNEEFHKKTLLDLQIIEEKIVSDRLSEQDKEEITQCVESINNSSPEALSKLKAGLEQTMYGVSGNIVFNTVLSIIQRVI